MNLGRSERAATLAQEELSLASHLGDHASMSNALTILGILAQARGDLAEAAGYFEQSYQDAQMGEDKGAYGPALMNLASIAIAQRDFSRARVLLEEKLKNAPPNQSDWATPTSLPFLRHIHRK